MRVPESSQPTIKAPLCARVSQRFGLQGESMTRRLIRICFAAIAILSMGWTSASQDEDNGPNVELIGVSTPPVDLPSNDKREWWMADGTALAESPLQPGALRLDADHRDGREFVFRLQGREGLYSPHVTIRLHKKRQLVELRAGEEPWSQTANTWNRETQSSLLEYAVGPVGNADFATIELKLASRTRIEIRYDQDGQRIDDDPFFDDLLDGAVYHMFRQIHLLRAGPHEDGFAVWTKPFSSGSEYGFISLALRDEKSECLHSGGQSDGTEQIFLFRTRPEDVQEFAFQFHPYEHTVTISNVSLKAGHQTAPETNVEPIARRRISEQFARYTLVEEYRDSIEFVPAADGLEDLHVRDLPISGWQFVSLLTDIRSIEIQGGDMRGGPLRRIAEIPGLKSLSIVDAKCLPEDLRLLAGHLTLESLSVSLTTPDELADEKARPLLWYYSSFAERDWIEKNLTRLSESFPDAAVNRHRLEAAVLTDRALWDLTELKNLTSLRLVNSPISIRGLMGLKLLPQLQHLSIEIIDQTAETGAELASFPALQCFGPIEANPEVFRELKKSKTLEELVVFDLTDDGVEDLIGIFRLKRLHLRASSLSDEGLMKLSRLNQLTELSFEATKGTITDDGIARLRSQLPDCRFTGDVQERTKDQS